MAIFEVYPEVKLADISKVKLSRPVSDVTDADMERP